MEQWDTDGNRVKALLRDLRMPATAYVSGDYVAIGELKGRVTILRKDNRIVAQVGDNPNESQCANYGLDPSQWTEAFATPFTASLLIAGNLIVAEWSQFGRILKFAVKK